MDSMRDEFRELYLKHWSGFEAFYRTISNPPLSSPLLISPSDRYQLQSTKLFVIGQETHSWYNDVAANLTGPALVDALMTKYKDEFQRARTYSRPPFWRFIRGLESKLGIEPTEILWSNIHSCDRNGRRPYGLEAELRQHFPVLQEEIRIGSPDVVLFFTGINGHNDDFLRDRFPDYERLEVLGSDGRLAMIKHPQLPRRTFKMDHPNYLSRCGRRKWGQALEVVHEFTRNQ
jgi:hypothetical protein